MVSTRSCGLLRASSNLVDHLGNNTDVDDL